MASSPLRQRNRTRARTPSRRPPLRRLIGLLLFAALAVPVAGQPAGAQGDEASEPVVRDITFPVVGPVDYGDTWGACRGYRCSRSHRGADIFGLKLQPLVAAADGKIVAVRRTSLTSAGNKVVVEDDQGWRYLYFHLNNDSPGTDDGANPQAWIIPNRLRVGDRVRAGDVIGYLGDSGNAERTPNHLHFEIHEPGVGAINPTPSLDAAISAGRVVSVASLASTKAGRAEHEELIRAWYRALLKREPTGDELFAWADRFDIGFADRDDLIADLTMSPQRYVPSGTVLRGYQVVLARMPTITELREWEAFHRDGASTVDVVQGLLASEAFDLAHADLSDGAFIEVIYRNARGRPPTERVRQYWLTQLAEGRPRAEMAAYFVDSYGLKNTMWHELEVIQAYRAALDRLPTDEQFNGWVAHLDNGGQIVDVVASIRS